jgi:hypothetical protein
MPATAGYVHEPGNSGYRLQAHDYAHSVIPWVPGQCPFYTTDSNDTVMIRESAIRFIRRPNEGGNTRQLGHNPDYPGDLADPQVTIDQF